MKPLFPRWSNTVFRAGLFAGAVVAIGSVVLLMVWVRAPYVTGQFDPIDQPIAFDHRHHVRDDGIDCLYCHSGAQRTPYAGVPSSALCMNCHSQVWNDSARLKPLRDSYFSGTPIRWVRVHQLPDFVFFDHSAHVNHGVGCSTCHGRVDLMASVHQVASLSMDWCLTCHRQPADALRPLDRITDMEWAPGDPGFQYALMQKLGAQSMTSCTTCHR
jgi:hypothetical protein